MSDTLVDNSEAPLQAPRYLAVGALLFALLVALPVVLAWSKDGRLTVRQGSIQVQAPLWAWGGADVVVRDFHGFTVELPDEHRDAAVRAVALARAGYLGTAALALAIGVIGIGQWRLRAWARPWSVAWALVAMPFVIVLTFVVLPMAVESLMPLCRAVAGGVYLYPKRCPRFPVLLRLAGCVFMLIYPAITLVYFNSDRARRRMG